MAGISSSWKHWPPGLALAHAPAAPVAQQPKVGAGRLLRKGAQHAALHCQREGHKVLAQEADHQLSLDGNEGGALPAAAWSKQEGLGWGASHWRRAAHCACCAGAGGGGGGRWPSDAARHRRACAACPCGAQLSPQGVPPRPVRRRGGGYIRHGVLLHKLPLPRLRRPRSPCCRRPQPPALGWPCRCQAGRQQ